MNIAAHKATKAKYSFNDVIQESVFNKSIEKKISAGEDKTFEKQ